MKDSFLQSHEWVEFQKSLGRDVVHTDTPIETNAIVYPTWLGQHILYIPHGPTIDFENLQEHSHDAIVKWIKELQKFAIAYNVAFIRSEPLNDATARALVKHGFVFSKNSVQPSKTTIVDISQSEDTLLAQFHHKTRYNIHVAERHEVEVRQSNNVDEFITLLKSTTERDNFSAHPESYYRKLFHFFQDTPGVKCMLFTAYHQDKPLASALVLTYKEVGYYLHGASDHSMRHMMAPQLLHWRIMQFLKTHEYKEYDLWGIDANRYPGVTRFKLQWNGKVVEYPGTFELPVKPFIYKLYTLAKHIYSFK